MTILVGPDERRPGRAPRSVRRTATVDMLRHDGMSGPLSIVARGRDLFTDAAGGTRNVDAAEFEFCVGNLVGHRIESLAAQQAISAAIEHLVGTSASTGFRRRLRSVRSGSLLRALLDEIPVAVLLASAVFPTDSPNPTVDVCAGWVSDGWLVRNVATFGLSRNITAPAPDVVDPADPLGWHDFGDLAGDAVRRFRRTDVVRVGERGDLFAVDSMFRDVKTHTDGRPVVLHEYVVRCQLDGGTIVAIDPEPRLLPGPDCPSAAASAQRLIGRSVHGLRDALSSELHGVNTCTHLNDALRALGDLDTLTSVLRDEALGGAPFIARTDH